MTDTSFIIRDGKFVINSQKFVNKDTGCEDPGAGECFGNMDAFGRVYVFRKLATAVTAAIEDVDFTSLGGYVENISLHSSEALATDNQWWDTGWFTKDINANPTGTITIWARIKFCFGGFYEPSGELYHTMQWKKCKFFFQVQLAPDSSGSPGSHFATFEGEAISNDSQSIPSNASITFNELGVGDHAGTVTADTEQCWNYSRTGNHRAAMIGIREYFKEGDPEDRHNEFLLVRLGSTVTLDAEVELAAPNTSDLNNSYTIELIIPPGIGPEANDYLTGDLPVSPFTSSGTGIGPKWATGGSMDGSDEDDKHAWFLLNGIGAEFYIRDVVTNERFSGLYVKTWRDDEVRPDTFSVECGQFWGWDIDSAVPWETDETYYAGDVRFFSGGINPYNPPDGSGYTIGDTPGATHCAINFTQGSDLAAVEELPEAYQFTIKDRLTNTILAEGTIFREFWNYLEPDDIWVDGNIRMNNYINLDATTGLVTDGCGVLAAMGPKGGWRGFATPGMTTVAAWELVLVDAITPSATGVPIDRFIVAPSHDDNDGPRYLSRALPAETQLDIEFFPTGDPRG